jgi:type I restriction enzyme S subunit
MSKPARPMKASGLGWAGDIPADWDVVKICLVATLESGHTPSRQHPEYWVPSECTIPWFSLADVWQLREGTQEYLGETSECISPMGIARSAARLLPAGTVVLSRTASVGFAGIMPRPMATTQDFANWVPGERLVSEYLLYALRAMRDEFSRVMTGSTHQTIYMPDIRRLAIPVPPREEQERIVKQLRAQLPKVDALIAKKERLLELLAEKRQALIAQAVTKGLDPSVPMKDSGVNWIGKVPAHWKVRRLKSFVEFLDHRRIPLSGEERAGLAKVYPYYGASGIIDEVDRYLFDEDLILVGEDGANILARSSPLAFIARGKYWVNNHAHVLRPRGGDLHFWEALLESISYVPFASGSAQPKLTREALGDIPFAAPDDAAEQREIGNLVQRATERFSPLVQLLTIAIEKLREYRRALITAAVTGKLEAGSAAASRASCAPQLELELA